MTDTKKIAQYFALVIDTHIQMNIETGQLEIYERHSDAMKAMLQKNEIIKVDVSRSIKS